MRGCALACSCLFAAGCGWFGMPGSSGGSNSGGGQVGYGAPALELTVAGEHYGPAAPDSGSSASISSSSDATGQVTDSTFRLGAQAASIGASCSIALDRFGQGITPFEGGGYMVMSATGDMTPDGTATPSGSLTVSSPGGTFQCAGTACDGTALVLSTVAADHVEGYLSGTFLSSDGSSSADVVCSFYVPIAN